MGSTIATGTVSIPLYLVYRCSYCGNISASVQVISETRDETKHGTVIRKSKREEMKESASEAAREAMGDRLRTIFEESKEHKYRAAEFNCRCSKCFRKEAWSRMRFTRVEYTLCILSTITALVALVMLFTGDFIGFAIVGGGIGITLGSWFISKRHRIKAMEERISQLPEESLPIIALSKEELIEKVNNRYGEIM